MRNNIYDPTFDKDFGPTVIGLLIIFIGVVFKPLLIAVFYSNKFETKSAAYFCLVVLYISMVYYIYISAKKRNRNLLTWLILGVIIPIPSLIVVGFLKRIDLFADSISIYPSALQQYNTNKEALYKLYKENILTNEDYCSKLYNTQELIRNNLRQKYLAEQNKEIENNLIQLKNAGIIDTEEFEAKMKVRKKTN